LLKNSHLAAVLVASLCGVALPHLRVRSCGCDDLAAFEQPELAWLKNSHLAAVLVASLCGVALPHLRVRSCGCDDLAAFEQPGLVWLKNSHLAAVVPDGGSRFEVQGSRLQTQNIEH